MIMIMACSMALKYGGAGVSETSGISKQIGFAKWEHKPTYYFLINAESLFIR